MKRINSNLIFVLFFIITSILLHHKSYDTFPKGRYALQQSDHYALALGFLDNGFDFFHPSSFSLTHQYPPKETLANPQGITAADFPILHFSVAFLMKIFDSKSPMIFRLVNLFWSFIALWFFFRTMANIKGFWIALFLSAFIMFQPIYSYYMDGFHVSIAAYNASLIGISYTLRYFIKGKGSFFLLGLLFLTLGALMRFTQIILLIALLFPYIYIFIKKNRSVNKLLYILVCIGLVFIYFAYNRYLSSTYGSIFLNTPRIANSMNEFGLHFLKGIKLYLVGFIPLMHLFALGLAIFLFVKTKKINYTNLESLKIWIIFTIIGVSIFSILMSFGLSWHDYYSLDTWLPVMTLLIVYFCLNIDLKTISNNYIKIFVLMFILGSFSLAYEKQNHKYDRYLSLRKADLVINDFKRSAIFLDSYVLKNDKVLIITNYGWNSPMIGWPRKAYRVADNFTEQIPLALQNKPDIIITHDANFNDGFEYYPDFLSQVKYLNGNGMVSLWTLRIDEN